MASAINLYLLSRRHESDQQNCNPSSSEHLQSSPFSEQLVCERAQQGALLCPEMHPDTPLGSAPLPATSTIRRFIKKFVVFHNPQALAAVPAARPGILITGTNLFVMSPH